MLMGGCLDYSDICFKLLLLDMFKGQFSPKLHENKKNWSQKGARIAATPLGSANKWVMSRMAGVRCTGSFGKGMKQTLLPACTKSKFLFCINNINFTIY